jgi:hypothetical protein
VGRGTRVRCSLIQAEESDSTAPVGSGASRT